ncbi:MAG: hypothetical protein SVR81_08975 [Chloroflexota bacterium]|nr:hypothetical protein [Chloroflexota bacterium]
MNGIGVLNEQHLHRALKDFYAQDGAHTEVKIQGYVVDVVREDGLVEIQTGNFTSIKHKLAALVQYYPLKLVYPIATEKWLLKYPDKDGKGTPTRRKSPKRARPVAVFEELVRFPQLLISPNFTLDIVLIQEEEVRCRARRHTWRNKGWRTVERRLLEVVEVQTYENPAQMARFLPETLSQTFTSADLTEKLAISRRLAGRMAYCLREMGTIEQVGKRNRFNLYARSMR